MELRHLRYFIAVAEEQNVTRAAKRLHLSQPPLTRQIQELEAEVGALLFTRTGRSIRLTDAGRIMLTEARAVLARTEQALAAVRDHGTRIRGKLTFGYSPVVTNTLLTPALAAFKSEAPDVKVELRDLSASEMIEGVKGRALDAAFMTRPSRLSGSLRFETLRSSQLRIVAAKTHPLSHRRSFSVRELLKAPLLLLDETLYPDRGDLLAHALGAKAKHLRPVETFQCAATYSAALASGRGIGLDLAEAEEKLGSILRFIPLAPRIPVILGALTSPHTGNPSLDRFINLVRVQGASSRR